MSLQSAIARAFLSLGVIGSAAPFVPAHAQTNLQYQLPPKAIVDLIDAAPTPGIVLSPRVSASAKRWILIEHFAGLPTIADLAQPELRLAGLRFNPKTDGPSRGRYATSLELQSLPDGKPVAVSGFPANAKLRFAAWSPDGSKISVVNISDAKEDAGLTLWIVDASTAQAHRIPAIALDGIFARSGFGGADLDSPCEWLSDSQSLICKTVPKDRGPAPARSDVPAGPVVQQNLGRVTPGVTFEDLLRNPEDEQFFDYYATSQIQTVRLDGTAKSVGKPGVFESASPSPDGQYVLVSERHRPYSYVLPFEAFPQRVSVINLKTGASKQLVDKPLEDNVPVVRDAVATGPRDYE